jgi:hypothetical protein
LFLFDRRKASHDNREPLFQVYKQYIKLTFSVIIPLLVLLLLNLRIFLAMRRSRLRFLTTWFLNPGSLTNWFLNLRSLTNWFLNLRSLTNWFLNLRSLARI